MDIQSFLEHSTRLNKYRDKFEAYIPDRDSYFPHSLIIELVGKEKEIRKVDNHFSISQGIKLLKTLDPLCKKYNENIALSEIEFENWKRSIEITRKYSVFETQILGQLSADLGYMNYRSLSLKDDLSYTDPNSIEFSRFVVGNAYYTYLASAKQVQKPISRDNLMNGLEFNRDIWDYSKDVWLSYVALAQQLIISVDSTDYLGVIKVAHHNSMPQVFEFMKCVLLSQTTYKSPYR